MKGMRKGKKLIRKLMKLEKKETFNVRILQKWIDDLQYQIFSCPCVIGNYSISNPCPFSCEPDFYCRCKRSRLYLQIKTINDKIHAFPNGHVLPQYLIKRLKKLMKRKENEIGEILK